VPPQCVLWPRPKHLIKLVIGFLDAEIAIEHQQRLSQRLNDCVQVAARLSKLVVKFTELTIAVAHFLIGDAELFVGGLQLFFRGLQLLVGTQEFLICGNSATIRAGIGCLR
jgi:hypothetical protein